MSDSPNVASHTQKLTSKGPAAGTRHRQRRAAAARALSPTVDPLVHGEGRAVPEGLLTLITRVGSPRGVGSHVHEQV